MGAWLPQGNKTLFLAGGTGARQAWMAKPDARRKHGVLLLGVISRYESESRIRQLASAFHITVVDLTVDLETAWSADTVEKKISQAARKRKA